VPAAAVIPAPIAYIKVVAVKKLVVGSRFIVCGPPHGGYFTLESLDGFRCVPLKRFTSLMILLIECHQRPSLFTLNKLECSKQVVFSKVALNNLAWNNRIGLCFYSVGLR
jgi:hypothetical protein